jgi:Zn-dependent protease with chaperone function
VRVVTGLAFLLALGAVIVPLAWAASAGSLVLLPIVRRWSPVARADAAAWLALAPALAALALAAAVATPSVLYGIGLGFDHCTGHGHHDHLCLWHGAELPAWLAAVGAVAWAVVGVRFGRVLVGLVRMERVGAGLAGVARIEGEVHVVPTSIAVCHTIGVVRPRVFVSRAVVDRLGVASLRAVVAHERAHLSQHHPAWSAALAFAAAFAPPASMWLRAWRDAAEEVADDVAAAATDGPTVADAIVAVARMNLGRTPGFAFGDSSTERRVTRLLDARAAPRKSAAWAGAVAMLGAALTVVAVAHEPLHHAVEELWEGVVGS